MSAREPVGPFGWSCGLYDADDFRCECGAVEDFDREFCRHDSCPECRDASECCLECNTCHRFTDADECRADEGENDTCVDCQVAAMERAEEQRGRDEYLLEQKGDEMRDERAMGGAA